MGLVAVLAETGISRRLVHLAAAGDDVSGMDAAAGVLADASLVGFSVDDAVAAHRLVMRVVRERLAADGRLAAVAAEPVQLLARLRGEITEAWRDPAGVRELADHISALTGCVQRHLNPPDAGLAAGLLQVRLGSVYLLSALSRTSLTPTGRRGGRRRRSRCWSGPSPTTSGSWAPTTRTP